jgi:putative Mn2+ efflux pump MntP
MLVVKLYIRFCSKAVYRMELARWTAMDYLTLILLSLGLSLDDFGLAFALSLLMSSGTFKKLMVNAGKMAVAFSISTALLPLLGWFVGLAIYGWFASFSAWVVLIVFAGVGVWIIKEAFEDEKPKWMMEKVSSFWALSAMGVLGSIDEGAVGVSYPFLEIPVLWIIVAVLLANTVLVLFATLLSNWIKNLSRKFPSILSGIILILLGVLKFLESTFRI